MNIGEKYYHHCTKSIVIHYDDCLSNISEVITNCPHIFQPSASPKIKSYFEESLNRKGWVSNVRIDSRTAASVSFMKLDVAFVFQVGNIARAYADLLKLTLLVHKQVTSIGILAVACRNEAKLMGANYANYERVVNELVVYSDILFYPLLVLGITN